MPTKRKTTRKKLASKTTTKVVTENRRLKTALKKVSTILKRAISVKKRKPVRKRSLL